MPDSWAVASNNYWLSMYFGSENGGWSEKHCLTATQPSNGITMAQTILDWRISILPKADYLIYSKINIPGGPRESILVPRTYPELGGWELTSGGPPATVTPGSNVPNTDDDCVAVRKQTTFGFFSTFFIHGIPDMELSGDVLTGGFPTVPGAIPPAVPAPAPGGWTTNLGTYLAVIQADCVITRIDTGGGQGPPVLMSSTIANIIPRKVMTKKIGRPFDQERGRRTIH